MCSVWQGAPPAGATSAPGSWGAAATWGGTASSDTSQAAGSAAGDFKESEREAIKSFPFTLHGYLMCFIPYTSSTVCP